MRKHYENDLNDILDQVAYEGFITFPKWRLIRWYGQERFTIGIRRDIRERWEDLGHELPWIKDKGLKFGETDGNILLVWGNCFFPDDE